MNIMKRDYEHIIIGMLTTSVKYAKLIKEKGTFVKNISNDFVVSDVMEEMKKLTNEFIF